MKTLNSQFALVYRTGGKLSCKWNRVLENFETRQAAEEAATKIEKMGYKTLIFKRGMLDSIGLPEGWEA
jgi:hypothetical protein